MAELYHTIYFSKNIDPDAIIAVFLLREFGEISYPGIGASKVETLEKSPEDKNGWVLEEEGIISFCFDDAKFPRRDELSLSRQVYTDLKIKQSQALEGLLKIAEDSEEQGGFNFFEIIKNLCKEYKERPEKAFEAARPVLKSHYSSLLEKYDKLPGEYMKAFDSGKVHAFLAKQKGKPIRVMVIESDSGEMSQFLHNREEILADIVAQKFDSGFINISTRYKLRIDLSDVVAIIRLDEARKKKMPFDKINWNDLRIEGRMDGLEEWYFDPEISGLFNFSSAKRSKPSNLGAADLKRALLVGLDFENFDSKCPAKGCRGKKCRNYFYNLLRCKKRRMNAEKVEMKEKKNNLKQNIKILDQNEVVKITAKQK